MDTVFSRRVLAAMNCLLICNVFDRLFRLRRIFISKEHMQPYIWVVPSLFQEIFYSEAYYLQGYCVSLKQALQVIPFFKGIKLIRNSSCSHTFDEQQNKRAHAAKHSFKFTVLFQSRNCSKKISQLLIMKPPWFQAYLDWKRSVTWPYQLHRSTWANPYFEYNVFTSL